MATWIYEVQYAIYGKWCVIARGPFNTNLISTHRTKKLAMRKLKLLNRKRLTES